MSVSAIFLMLTYHLVFCAVASLAAKQQKKYSILYYCHEKGRQKNVSCTVTVYLSSANFKVRIDKLGIYRDLYDEDYCSVLKWIFYHSENKEYRKNVLI